MDASLQRLIPSDTLQLAGIRLDLIRQTQLYKKYGPSAVPMLESFSRGISLDASKDIDEMLAASNGKDVLTLMRGRFSSPEFKKNLERLEGQATLLDDKTLALGTPALVTWAKTGKGGGVPKSLLKLMQEIPTSQQIWALNNGGALPIALPSEGNAANLERIFATLSSVVMWGDLSRGVKLGAVGHGRDEAGARQIEGALRAGVGLGRLSAGTDQKELLSAFDMIKITRTTTTVNLSTDLAMDQIEALRLALNRLSPGVRP
jgi:hypothetical protein